MTELHDLSFSEFADAIRPSGGMNRWPKIGTSAEVVSYSVSMNGDVAGRLAESARDHEFRDVAIHALTEKLGLDPHSFRDNIKVAELVALRHAYLATVLEASIMNTLKPEVHAEYELVTQGFTHPLVARELENQRAYGALLRPALDEAIKVIGGPGLEKPAAGVSRGAIVSQNAGYTVQSVGEGEIVVHENRRLDNLPHVGQDVTVAYYRGKGTVIENMAEINVGEVYVDQQSGDLAVNLSAANGNVTHVVMFNSMAMVAEFAQHHQLPKTFVELAMSAREASPKSVKTRPVREPLGEPYFDASSGSLSVDYAENSIKFTAVFADADDMSKRRDSFNLTPAAIALAVAIDKEVRTRSQANVSRSLQSAQTIAAGSEIKPVDVTTGRYSGTVIGLTQVHVIQDRGRNEVSIHDKRLLDKVPMIGETLTIGYRGGRAEVKIKDLSKERTNGRT